MVKANPTGQQPMPPSDEAPGPEKSKPFGVSEAKKKPGDGKTKYDKPSEASDDFAIDEKREKRVRGNEAPKDVSTPD
ncbi:hypothetical protein [Jannaschia formosa]|uniref:hypothetical protein n=1 Tax=Jannaschia formosa TaxID=2259592 RepID=UPI000E1BDA4B|nr:hypothetical protein [Jannaschia formosa]TFL16238.1 hypothetical protein DR046_20980 [Jannaschia formosa]